MTRAILSVDIGGTSQKYALVDPKNPRCILREVTVPTDQDDFALSEKYMVKAAQELLVGYSPEDIVALGIGLPGVVVNGILIGSGNLRGWLKINVPAAIRAAFGLRDTIPTVTLNDCGAAALGEYVVFGKRLIYIIWGTGIGVAMVEVHNGQVTVTETELGHIIIGRHSKARCGCGGRGHWEALAGGGNIDGKRFRRFLLFGFRRIGKLKERHWEKVLRDMAIGISAVSAAQMDTPVVIGGGVMCKQKHRINRLRKLVANLKTPAPTPELYVSELDQKAGLVGAAYAARRALMALPNG